MRHQWWILGNRQIPLSYALLYGTVNLTTKMTIPLTNCKTMDDFPTADSPNKTTTREGMIGGKCQHTVRWKFESIRQR